MKTLSYLLSVILLFISVSLKAQKKAQLDNNMYIAVVQSQTTTGKVVQTHYKMTNNNTVSMDFSLYKQMNDGSWDVVHHLDLQPGDTYEDVSTFTGYNGKYAVFSAPHSDWATFPDVSQVGSLITAAPMQPPPPPQPSPAQTAPVNH